MGSRKNSIYKPLISKGILLFSCLSLIFIQCKKAEEKENLPKRLPTVSTLVSTAWDQFSITMQGNISSTGNDDILERGFVYGQTMNASVDSNKVVIPQPGFGPYSIQITGLKEKTLYYIKAYAKTRVGIGYGEPVGVSTTYGPIPSIDLLKVDVNRDLKDSLYYDANLREQGGTEIQEKGILFSEKANKLLGMTDIVVVPFGDKLLGNFSGKFSNPTSLKPNTQYFIKAYARNKSGVAYSAEATFRTSGLVLLSDIRSKFTKSGDIILEGKVNDGGSLPILEQGFLWGPATISNNSFVATNVNVKKIIISNISNDKIIDTLFSNELAVGTKYKFRVYCRNIRGFSYPKENPSEFRYLPIGAEYQDGFIYRIDPDDPSKGWIVYKNEMPDLPEWGCIGDTITTSSLFGTSKVNTDNIVNLQKGCAQANIAAKVCRALSQTTPPPTTANPWSLPCQQDLELIMDTLAKKGIGNFDLTKSYWSSTQEDAVNALTVGLVNNKAKSTASKKNLKFKVRAIRAIN